MNEQIQTQQMDNLEQIAQNNQHKLNININSDVSVINQTWVKNTINEFLEDHKEIANGELTLHFKIQPIRKKILKCIAYVKTNASKVSVIGEGRDEYEAITDLLNNLDIETRISIQYQNNQKGFFFSQALNKLSGDGQCA